MKSKVLKLFALVLSLLMILSVFAACTKEDEEIIYKDQYGNIIDPDSLNNSKDQGGEETPDNTASEEDNTDNTNSDTTSSGGMSAAQQGSGSGSGSGGQTTVTPTGKTKFESDPYSDIPASLKGTTVRVLLWRTPEKTDTELAAAFTKKTGIKLEYVYTANNNAAYSTKLATMISSKDSPDLVSMGSGTFPSFAITHLEPLDASVFRLEDPFWDEVLMDAYKINGKYYALAAPEPGTATTLTLLPTTIRQL